MYAWVCESDFEDDFQPQISRESSRWNAPPRFSDPTPFSEPATSGLTIVACRQD